VKNIAIIIQARMGSSRLPGKILKKIADKTVLGHILTRLKKVQYADQIIVATSINTEDDLVVDECKKYDVACFRGSNEDVLSRYYFAALKYNATDIVRICADNLLVDWNIIDAQIKIYKESNHDIVYVGSHVPLGLGGEIFSFSKLEEAHANAKKEYQREHVTPYLYETYEDVYKYQIEKDFSKYRFTLDTNEDWILVNKIYEILYKGEHDFSLEKVVDVMGKNPSLYEINKNIQQIKVGKEC